MSDTEKEGSLAHEKGSGAPCLKCGPKCAGLDLHFWRKTCKNCKCKEEDHQMPIIEDVGLPNSILDNMSPFEDKIDEQNSKPIQLGQPVTVSFGEKTVNHQPSTKKLHHQLSPDVSTKTEISTESVPEENIFDRFQAQLDELALELLPSPPPDVIGNDNVDAGPDFAFSSEVTESDKLPQPPSTHGSVNNEAVVDFMLSSEDTKSEMVPQSSPTHVIVNVEAVVNCAPPPEDKESEMLPPPSPIDLKPPTPIFGDFIAVVAGGAKSKNVPPPPPANVNGNVEDVVDFAPPPEDQESEMLPPPSPIDVKPPTPIFGDFLEVLAGGTKSKKLPQQSPIDVKPPIHVNGNLEAVATEDTELEMLPQPSPIDVKPQIHVNGNLGAVASDDTKLEMPPATADVKLPTDLNSNVEEVVDFALSADGSKSDMLSKFFESIPKGSGGHQYEQNQRSQQPPAHDVEGNVADDLQDGEEKRVNEINKKNEEATEIADEMKPCANCNEKFKNGDAAIFANRAGSERRWHVECFACFTCKEQLADLTYFFKDEKIYCARHYGELMDLRCAKCAELIVTQEYTIADGKNYHLEHFCCLECDKLLGGESYVCKDGQTYCMSCYRVAFAKTCHGCQESILPDAQCLAYEECNWHANEDCFCCCVCKASLIDQQFIFKDNKSFCSAKCVGL